MSEDGSEGSPARPVRRVRRVMVVSSASESEGDCSDVPLGTRRKRLRVLSDDGSDSSGSSIVARRRRTLRALRDSDADTDSSSSDAAAPKPTSGFTSDSSEGNSDKCSICLLRFKDQEVGTPETCEHIFCLDCITEWSQNVNTCPVDRITFNSIVVRACAGGRVLRTDPVKVAERRPSVDIPMVEQPTACEVCGRTNDEDTMLLCDACDLGYHMQCLTPPLTEIPVDQWFCPNCDDMLDVIQMSELDDLLDGIDMDMPLGPRDVPLRQPRNTRRSARNRPADERSTSSGRRANGTSDAPSTSRGTRTSRAPVRRRATTHRRKYKRRRTKTVIIEYDVEENGKFPVTKTVKRRVKKRKSRKKQPRTAARRSYVRASVRAQLAAQQLLSRGELSQTGLGVQELGLRRHRAGIPALSLLGNPNQLDYFSEEDADISEGATAAVAVASRPTSSILSAYRQARRKMVSIPSPSHAASAPDLLDSILHDQTKLHSKKSVVSITVDGKVDIKIESRERIAPKNSTKDGSSGLVVAPKKDEISNGRVDLSKAEDATRKAPSYPGQGRSGGGWGGGYRGNYHREHGTGNFSRGYDYGAGPPARPAAPFGPGGARRDDDIGNNYARRPLHYAHNDESFDRPRRHPDTGRGPHPHPDNRGSHILDNRGPHFNPDNNRGPNFNPDNNRGPNFNPDNNRGPNFMPENNRGPHMHENNRGPHMHESNRGPHMHDNNRGPHMHENNRGPHIHSENNRGPHMHGENNRGPHMQHGNNRGPHMQHENNQGPLPLLDNNRGPHNQRLDGRHSLGPWQPYSGAPRPEAPQRHSFGGFDDPLDMRMDPTPSFRPLPEPPAFKFDAAPDVDKSEEEEDSGLVIDTEKYDPTEPTFDEDSCSEEPGTPTMQPSCPPAPPTPPPVQALPSPPAPPPLVQNILAGLNTNIVVTSEIIDDAVRQVLQEHRNLIIPPSVQSQNDSDSDSDGDCPNFSIYSATSVHIASGGVMPAPPPVPEDRYDEDLVQQDDEPTPPPDTPSDDDQPETPTKTDIVRNKEEEYKEKVSKRCPITANTRNPIKIKLHTPALIKRQLTLYDDEDVSEDVEPTEESSPTKIADSTKKESAKDVTDDITEDNDEQEEDYADNKSDDEKDSSDELKCSGTPEEEDCERENDINLDATPEDKDDEEDTEKAKEVTSEGEVRSEVDDEVSEGERQSQKSPKDAAADDGKMTESLSETEDERSYTPCLDENKSKDTSLETDKDKGIEGLDTEMISEEEGNGIFSDNEAAASLHSQASPPPLVAAEEAEIAPAKKDSKPEEEGKKKKKKESKKDGKEKGKGKKKGDVTFKKLSKSGKERNYRERDKDDKKSKKERRESGEAGERRRRKERRKDLERYDVRSVVTEKRRKGKDAFGRDVSPRAQSATPPPVVPPSPAERRLRSPSPALSPPPPRRARHSLTPRDTSPRAPPRRDTTPRRRRRRSITPRRKSITPRRRSITPRRKSITPRRKSFTPRRRSMTPRRKSISPRRPSVSPLRRKSISPRRRSISRGRKASPRRRRSGSRARKRPRRSVSPKPKPAKKKKRPERASLRRKSPKRKRAKRVSRSPEPPPLLVAAGGGGGGGGVADWSPPSVDSRLLSPRTPPPDDSPPPRIRSLIAAEEKRARRERRRRDAEALRMRHRRGKDTVGPSKEVFTSGDNILVSVSFKDQERDHDTGEKRKRKESKRERRRKRRRAAAAAVEAECAKPIAIIDLERSPFREITPSPKNVIVLSDSDHAEKEADRVPAAPAAVEPEPAFAVGPKTPPEPAAAAAAGAAHTPEPPSDAARAAPAGPTTPPDSPDAYDPFEPTRSASGSPAPASAATPGPAAAAPDAPRTLMTLETAQKTNMSADEVLDRRPVSPMEKVMALLQSTRDVSPEPPPAPQGQQPDATPAPLSAPVMPAPLAAPPASMLAPAPAVTAPPVRIVLPSPTRAQQPKLFLTKPSPIKSNPVKPMQATKISRLPLPTPRRPPPDVELSPGADSPYSPGSSDFGDLFSPPAGPAAKQARRDTFDALFDKPPRARRNRSSAAKVPVKLNKKKGNKTQVGVKIDEDNLKILDDLPSSAVEMQVKSKFLKKLNRQERVVEEVKLVLKPHYNKKHVTKDEYKDILRRTVPKICHNKNGEINPTKIQSLVEAYVKKFRKKHKLGLL